MPLSFKRPRDSRPGGRSRLRRGSSRSRRPRLQPTPAGSAGNARRSRRGRRRREASRRRRSAARAARRTRRPPPAHRGGRAAIPAARPRAARAAGARPCSLRRRASSRSSRRDRGVEPRVRAGGEPHLGQERLGRLGLARERTEDVERVDVSRALPDRVERALAEEPRQLRLLDVAVAAEALERLRDERRRPLADPELRDRGRQAAERPVRLVVGSRQPQRRHGRGLALDAEVGEDVLHQRLLGQQPAEGGAVRGVVRRLRDRAAHQRGRAEHAVEPRVVDHLEDRPQAATLLADEPGDAPSSAISAEAFERLPSLSFSRSIRKPGCGRSSRKQERPAGACASTRKASLIGAEQNHLWPSSTQASPSGRARRLVRAHVRAALTLGHRHPAERVAARQPRDPLLGELGLGAQRRHGGERHRERAADAGFDLAEQHEQRRPRDVRARPLVHPRQRLQARPEPEAQQRVPGRMELDLVDPLAVAVVRPQDRRVLVRQPPPLQRLAAERPRRTRRSRPPRRRRPRGERPRRARHPARRGCSPRAAAAGSRSRSAASSPSVPFGLHGDHPLHRPGQRRQAAAGARRLRGRVRSTATAALGSSSTRAVDRHAAVRPRARGRV